MENTVRIRDLSIGEGIPKVCIPVVGTNEQEILKDMKKAVTCGADLIEWRADFYENIFCEQALITLLRRIRECIGNTVLLFTFRTLEEGGEKKITPAEYKALNIRASRDGYIDLLDVEVNRDNEAYPIVDIINCVHSYNVRVILSKHDFTCTPSDEEMEQYLIDGNRSAADIVKLAVMPQSRQDVLRLLAVSAKFSAPSDKPFITMSMGPVGSITRTCGEYFGSAVTFGTAGKSSAPGQLEVNKLREVLHIFHESITGEETLR